MTQNYYPWNIQALSEWLQSESKQYANNRELANALGVSVDVLNLWLLNSVADINFSQLQSIARYRQWTIAQTAEWLRILPAHFEEMVSGSMPA